MAYTADREVTRQKLRAAAPVINPSLLSCDFGILAEEIATAERCGTPVVHWDVMDGAFVPNFTYGPPVIASLRPRTSVVFDVHLMMADPARYLDDFLKAGADVLTVHLEILSHPTQATSLLQRIREAGVLAGIAVNPGTPLDGLWPWLPMVDMVLVMSVQPGFGGQSFNPIALEKLRTVRQHGPADLLLEVDGGVNRGTVAAVRDAGAQVLVVGSAFYSAADRAQAYQELRTLLDA